MFQNEETPYPEQPQINGINENMPDNSINPATGSSGTTPDVEKDAMYTVSSRIEGQPLLESDRKSRLKIFDGGSRWWNSSAA